MFNRVKIMRAFIKLRHLLLENAELRQEIEAVRKDTEGKFLIVFQTLDQLFQEEAKPKKKIGFTAEEKKTGYRAKQKNG